MIQTNIHEQIKNYWITTLKQKHLRELLDDHERNLQMIAEFDGITFDYSHEKIDKNILDLFEQLANQIQLQTQIDSMFNGEKINTTENRAVLHVALRSKPQDLILVDGVNVVQEVHKILNRIEQFTDRIRGGEIRGFTQKSLQNLVVIGIGGSYLSIEFIHEALRTHHIGAKNASGRRLRFLANVDPVDFQRAIEGLNVEETLFLINSKTFTTSETMMNARQCKQWILDQYYNLNSEWSIEDQKQQVLAHMCAVSTNLIETSKFGLADDNVFGFWDWVGGRYSVCSAIGILPLSLQYGFKYMQQFLDGANQMDKHFKNTKQIKSNLPILFGLLTWFRASIQECQNIALLPYSQALNRFPAHIQQLSMESNGKQALKSQDNTSLYLEPADVAIFGEPGTNSQHSFFQMLHQGKNIIPCEFIGYSRSQSEYFVDSDHKKQIIRDQHDELMSNFFAQVDALARGKTAQEVKADGVKDELVQHKVFPGDRGSIQLLFKDEVNPYNLGQLLALYEHRVVVQGFLWNINSFDQWGVELGKVLAKSVREVMKNNLDPNQQVDFSGFNSNTATKNLIQKYRTNQQL